MKISVLTPCFDSENHISKAIESVLAQTYKNWEHIIVDGGSSDGTVDILSSYKHLQWISEPDRGQSDAMNKAFKLSTGQIIVYLNSDDYFYPEAFSIVINEFEKNKSADIIVGDLKVKNQVTEYISKDATVDWRDLSVIKGRFPLNPVSYFYKREVQEKIGDFPLNEHYTMDFWFLIRAFYKFQPVKINSILGCFVFDGHNKTSIIQDGFSIQMPHALSFSIKHTPFRTPKVYYELLMHNRNRSKISSFLKRMRGYFRRIRRKFLKGLGND